MSDISKIDMERIEGLLSKFEEVTNKLNSMKYVIETGKSEDGNQWYRKWSDGWIEQGGTYIPTKTIYRINYFIKQFINIPIVLGNTTYNGNDWPSNWSYPNHITTKQFQIYDVANNLTVWYACGY